MRWVQKNAIPCCHLAPKPRPMENTVTNKASTMAANMMKVLVRTVKNTGELLGSESTGASSAPISGVRPLETIEITAHESNTESTLLKPETTTSMITKAGKTASKGN